MKRKLAIKIQEALKHLDEGVEMLRGAGAKNAPNLKSTCWITALPPRKREKVALKPKNSREIHP
jgi:hypothetical protein